MRSPIVAAPARPADALDQIGTIQGRFRRRQRRVRRHQGSKSAYGLTETMILMLSLPVALVGGIWLMSWLGFNTSVAVAVGFIALAGVAAETGVIMLIYPDHAMEKQKQAALAEGRLFTKVDLNRAIMVGAVKRVRPKMMTVVAIMAGLLPILWRTGTGSEIMQRIAVPMIGGMVSSTLLTLVVIPAVYGLIKG